MDAGEIIRKNNYVHKRAVMHFLHNDAPICISHALRKREYCQKTLLPEPVIRTGGERNHSYNTEVF